MRKSIKFSFSSLAAVIVLMGAASTCRSEGTFENISPKQAAAEFSEKKAIIVDVREDNEWQEQHIPGAIHIPLGQLKARLSELEAYKNSEIITQCRSGGRSAKAVDQLKTAGFNNVHSLEGGIQAWEKEGLPLK
ncbi:MAG: rhodanese-like domain-containing protein [Methylococcales bacterium]|nr:rhodanese-like domain-containing protein [Methylococcaceae bacterium]